jgi:hypothetical protein
VAEHRPLGDILIESGRITREDVDRVLQHQRQHGGYFGEALVSLGIVRRGEIDWALANQFDLPFIFPTAESVDPEAARLVPADWALACLAVPIVRAGRTLTVVVANPLNSEALRELSARTGLRIDMALASADRVRELIHAVYGAGEALSSRPPRSCEDFLAEAVAVRAPRFGISRRGGRALGWLQAGEGLQRIPLLDGWEDHLEHALTPPPAERVAHAGTSRWACSLRSGARTLEVDARALEGLGGSEYLFQPSEEGDRVPQLGLPDGIAAELRLLASGGRARVALRSADPQRARTIVPHLPAAVFGIGARTVHLTESTNVPDRAFTLTVDAGRVPDDLASWAFDAITAEIPLDLPGLGAAGAATPFFVVLSTSSDDDARLRMLGIGWLLEMPGIDDAFGWTLRPLGG